MFLETAWGGATEKLVYGKRSSELGIASSSAITLHVANQENNAFNWVATADGAAVVSLSQGYFAGLKRNYFPFDHWEALIRTTDSNLAAVLYVKKGETVEFHFSGSVTCFFMPI